MKRCHETSLRGGPKLRGGPVGAAEAAQLSPRAHPWVLPEVLANPIIEQVVAALLGTAGRPGGAQLVAVSQTILWFAY